MDETPKENRWLSAPLRQRPSKEKGAAEDQGGDEIFSFPLKSGVAKFETKGITAVQLRSIRLFGLKSKEKKHQRILVIQLKEKLCVVLTSAETESSLWVAS